MTLIREAFCNALGCTRHQIIRVNRRWGWAYTWSYPPNDYNEGTNRQVRLSEVEAVLGYELPDGEMGDEWPEIEVPVGTLHDHSPPELHALMEVQRERHRRWEDENGRRIDWDDAPTEEERQMRRDWEGLF